MSPIRFEDVEILEGSVHLLVNASGITDFRIDERAITLHSSRATRHLREGDVVRLMVPARGFTGFLDVLALQRVDDGRVHSTASRLDPLVLLCAAALCALGFHSDLWWLALAPLLPVWVLFHRYDTKRLEIMRSFRAHLAELPALPVHDADTPTVSVR